MRCKNCNAIFFEVNTYFKIKVQTIIMNTVVNNKNAVTKFGGTQLSSTFNANTAKFYKIANKHNVDEGWFKWIVGMVALRWIWKRVNKNFKNKILKIAGVPQTMWASYNTLDLDKMPIAWKDKISNTLAKNYDGSVNESLQTIMTDSKLNDIAQYAKMHQYTNESLSSDAFDMLMIHFINEDADDLNEVIDANKSSCPIKQVVDIAQTASYFMKFKSTVENEFGVAFEQALHSNNAYTVIDSLSDSDKAKLFTLLGIRTDEGVDIAQAWDASNSEQRYETLRKLGFTDIQDVHAYVIMKFEDLPENLRLAIANAYANTINESVDDNADTFAQTLIDIAKLNPDICKELILFVPIEVYKEFETLSKQSIVKAYKTLQSGVRQQLHELIGAAYVNESKETDALDLLYPLLVQLVDIEKFNAFEEFAKQKKTSSKSLMLKQAIYDIYRHAKRSDVPMNPMSLAVHQNLQKNFKPVQANNSITVDNLQQYLKANKEIFYASVYAGEINWVVNKKTEVYSMAIPALGVWFAFRMSGTKFESLKYAAGFDGMGMGDSRYHGTGLWAQLGKGNATSIWLDRPEIVEMAANIVNTLLNTAILKIVTESFEVDELYEQDGKVFTNAGEESVIKKLDSGKYGIADKDGKLWDAQYDSLKEAADALKAYHTNEAIDEPIPVKVKVDIHIPDGTIIKAGTPITRSEPARKMSQANDADGIFVIYAKNNKGKVVRTQVANAEVEFDKPIDESYPSDFDLMSLRKNWIGKVFKLSKKIADIPSGNAMITAIDGVGHKVSFVDVNDKQGIVTDIAFDEWSTYVNESIDDMTMQQKIDMWAAIDLKTRRDILKNSNAGTDENDVSFDEYNKEQASKILTYMEEHMPNMLMPDETKLEDAYHDFIDKKLKEWFGKDKIQDLSNDEKKIFFGRIKRTWSKKKKELGFE